MKNIITIIAMIMLISCNANAQQANKTWHKYQVDTTANEDTHKHFQCMGTTVKGLRCKKKVAHEGDYCSYHQYQKGK